MSPFVKAGFNHVFIIMITFASHQPRTIPNQNIAEDNTRELTLLLAL